MLYCYKNFKPDKTKPPNFFILITIGLRDDEKKYHCFYLQS
jgi:hypothetical protein